MRISVLGWRTLCVSRYMWFGGQETPKGQGTHFGHQEPHKEHGNTVTFLDVVAVGWNTLPTQTKEMRKWGFLACSDWKTQTSEGNMIDTRTMLENRQTELVKVARWTPHRSKVKYYHHFHMLRMENSPGKVSLCSCTMLFCFVSFSRPLILNSCLTCSIAAKS